jgi:hypothetical protein
MTFAYLRSSGSPAWAIISSPITSSDIKPSVKPEKRADKIKSIAEESPVTHTGKVAGATNSQLAAV